jgi:hypothetical protein
MRSEWWEEYLQLRRRNFQEDGEDYIMTFIIHAL